MKLYRIFPLILLTSFLFIPVQGYGLTGSYQNLSGEMVNISTFEGKPLIIETIQTNCPACKESSHRSNMAALYNYYSDQVSFLVLSIRNDDTIQLMSDFVSEYNIKWIPGLDPNDILQSQLNIPGTPTVVLLDSDGVIRNSWSGYENTLQSYIDIINNFVQDPISLSTTETIDNANGGSSGSGSSIIGDIFGNPIFQISLVGVLVLMVYFRSTKT